MKRLPCTIALSIALIALAPTVSADDSGFYIGGGILSGSGTFENSIGGGEIDNDTSGGSFKLGYIMSGGNRIELAYSSIDLEFPTITRQVDGFDVDFLWTFGSSELKPYLGVGIGVYVFKDSAQFFAENKDLAGTAFNLSGGLIYEITRNFEVEAALRFKGIVSEEFQAGAAKGTWTQTMGNVYLGANIKF